jgi:hypothetical protein
VKQSVASVVLNRIPASADVMIWTVMNMRRSAKNMKLIDADKLILRLNDYALKKSPINAESAEGRKISREVYFAIRNCMKAVEEQPTAFDVDEVVQQLEMLIEDKCSESGDDWYTAQCLNEAVDIVQGGGTE